jgi:ligand-binding sensor domain-containing protein
MKRPVNTISILFLIGFLLLNIACKENKQINKEVNRTEIKLTEINDTLKFRSGIRSVMQDSKSNYWFGSDQEGACRYDGKTFTYFTPENGLCGKQVIYIREDQSGQIWFSTSNGLCYFDGIKIITVSRRQDNLTRNFNSKEYASWEVNSTDLWFPGYNSKEILRVAQGIPYTLKNPIEIPANKNPGDFGITGFSKSRKGGMWIAYYSGFAYNDKNKTQYFNDSTMQFDGKSKYMHVRSILEDSKGRLWIGNNGIGVQLMEHNSIIHFSEKMNLLKGKLFQTKSPAGTLMHVFVIKEDSQGNIWFGDRDTGAWRFDGKEMRNFTLDATLNTQHIWDICEDKNGNLLFTSGDRGIYKFNGNGFDRVF